MKGDKIFFVLMVALLENYQPPTGLAQNSMYSILMLAFTLPAILFGSAGGIFVDRFSKKLVLTVSNYIQTVLMLFIAFLPRDFFMLLLLTFGVSTLAQFFTPAQQAAIPVLVRRENFMAANAVYSTTMMGSLIVGFAIGEPILTLAKDWLGARYGQEIVVGVLYLLSGLAVQLINF